MAFVVCSTWAGGITAPFMYESTDVLPKGVHSFRFQGATTQATHSFNEFASPIMVGDSFNQQLTYGQLLKALPKENQAEYGGYLKSLQAKNPDLSFDSSAGDATGSVAVRVTASIPAFAYGVTDRWTVGIGVPIIYSNLSVATGYVASPQTTALAKSLAAKDPAAALKVTRLLQNVVQYNAALYHYDPIVDQEKTQMGDVNLVSKYLLVKEEAYAVAVANTIVLPTGQRANINKVVDVASGDGDYKLGVTGITDWYVLPKVTLTGAVSYLAQLPQQISSRIPISETETMSPDIDPSVYQDLGDIMRLTLGVRYAVTTEWSFLSAYNYQYKMPDVYRGAAFTRDRYALLEERTEQTMQSAQVGISYNTIAMYRRQQFAAPLEASLNYISVYDGRNVVRDGITSLAMSMYF
jgi:hypothetical protein